MELRAAIALKVSIEFDLEVSLDAEMLELHAEMELKPMLLLTVAIQFKSTMELALQAAMELKTMLLMMEIKPILNMITTVLVK